MHLAGPTTRAILMAARAEASETPGRGPLGSAASAGGLHAAARDESDGTDAMRVSASALSRWESEGGSDADRASNGPQTEAVGGVPLSDTELMHLRVRVIALENIVIALLAEAPVRQLSLARAMATYICPRPGYTPHSLTLRAAREMLSLVSRADRFSTPSTA